MLKEKTLLIYGSLAPEGCRKILADKGWQSELDVLEVETFLPKEKRAPHARWHSALDFHDESAHQRIDADTDQLLNAYLEATPPGFGESRLPLHRAFRAASLGMVCRKWINPFIVNLDLAKRLMAENQYHRIILAPGAGISFRAWKQAAGLCGAALAILPVEKRPWSFRRRWLRLLNRWRTRSGRSVPEPVLDATAGGNVAVYCASARLARILAREKTVFQWRHVGSRDLPSAPAEEISRLRAGYARWCQAVTDMWQEHLQSAPDSPLGILKDLAEEQSSRTYPAFAWEYLQALEMLRSSPPRLMLCDTQEGSQDLAWALAAQELGVPVASYTYDHVVQPHFSFSPDWLLCESGRHADAARLRGMPDARILQISSHRRPPSPMLKTRFGKFILYADSYYSGVTAAVEPQRSYKHYSLIVETARNMPDLEFGIKFHPLRDRKHAGQCFIGMDEDELHVRTQYLKSLRPPRNVRILPPESSMLGHLQRARVLLNSNSTTALEAFAMGVPVVFLHPPNTVLGYPRLHDFHCCLQALEMESLQKHLRRLLADPDAEAAQIRSQRCYVDDFYWPQGLPGLGEGIHTILSKLDTASQTGPTGTPAAGPNF